MSDVLNGSALKPAVTVHGQTHAKEQLNVQPIGIMPDAMQDVMQDATIDTMPDVTLDATIDTMPDVTLDATIGAMQDVTLDATIGAMQDVTQDATLDVITSGMHGGIIDVKAVAITDGKPITVHLTTITTAVTGRIIARVLALISPSEIMDIVAIVGHHLGIVFTVPDMCHIQAIKPEPVVIVS